MTPALLLALVGLHYGWALAPVEHQAQAWNILGAAARAGLLVAVLWRCRGLVLAVGAWWLCEEAMVIGCSVAYMVSPWPVAPGESQCSALLGYDLGRIGALVLAVLALLWARQPVRPDR